MRGRNLRRNRNRRRNDGDGSVNWPLWRFFDGSIAITLSMLLAALLRDCTACAGVPALGYLHGLTLRDDGVIIVGTILLFPTTATLYGGVKVFFAAREAVRRESREKGRQEGREEGREEERERIIKVLAKHGITPPPEVTDILNGKDR